MVTLKKAAVTALTILVVCGIAMLGVLPNPVKEEDYLYIDAGNTRIYTYKYGLALYEKGTQIFHNVSPFDMSYEDNSSVFQKYLETQAPRNNLLLWSDKVFSTESGYSLVAKKIHRIKSYFGLATPTAHFIKNTDQMIVQASKVKSDTIEFTVATNAQNKYKGIEMSFSLNYDDVVVDDKNDVYIAEENTHFNDFLAFYGTSDYRVLPITSLPNTVYSKYLVISNPKMSGFYKILLDKETASTDLGAKKISFFVDEDNPNFRVVIGNYFSEFLKGTNVAN